VVLRDPIRRNIIEDITVNDYELIGFTLTCSEETLIERHSKRGDNTECSFEWLRAEHYPGDYIINTDSKSVDQIVNEITTIIKHEHIQLHTADLTLRTVRAIDLNEVARMWEFEKCTISLEEAHRAIIYMFNNHLQKKPGCIYHLCLAVFEKNTNKIIGWCGLDGKTSDKLDVFYLIDSEYRNRGYATQCAERLLSYAFHEACVPYVNGGCDKDNIASIKVMTKIGMKQDGTEKNGDPLFYISKEQYLNESK
jgi:RimJ/RimL family protein N-acetyltransferase